MQLAHGEGAARPCCTPRLEQGGWDGEALVLCANGSGGMQGGSPSWKRCLEVLLWEENRGGESGRIWGGRRLNGAFVTAPAA